MEELQPEPKSQGVHFLSPVSPSFIAKPEQQPGDSSAISTFCFSDFPIRAQKNHDPEELHYLSLNQIFHLHLWHTMLKPLPLKWYGKLEMKAQNLQLCLEYAASV